MNTKAHWSRIRFGFVPPFFVELWKKPCMGSDLCRRLCYKQKNMEGSDDEEETLICAGSALALDKSGYKEHLREHPECRLNTNRCSNDDGHYYYCNRHRFIFRRLSRITAARTM